jgi:hypothetical protein
MAPGRLEVKPTEDRVCFTWERVRFPESGCFRLFAEREDAFSLRADDGRRVLEYTDARGDDRPARNAAPQGAPAGDSPP